MAELDLQAVHDELVSVAYEAGAMILEANPAELDTDTKLNCKSVLSLTTPLT
jgi:myo-inositol-1(or 4)-monophosphatase